MASTTYSAPGTYTFTLPTNIDLTTPLTVDLKGAGGGQGDKNNIGTRAAGGAGGHVVGTIDLTGMTPGVTQITVVVGGKGNSTPSVYTGNETSIAGGYNGGGSVPCNASQGYGGAGSGGGATDVRVGGTALANRKAVAAGGGGSGSSAGATNTWGGAGGAGGAGTGASGTKNGTSGGSGGSGGTQTAGGAGGANTGGNSGSAGGLGVGGAGGSNGGDALNGYLGAGGAGGGGYYGGGGGGEGYSLSVNTANGGGGAGGSNYAGGLLASTTNSQGGGSAQNTDGSAVLTYNLVPNQPTLNSPVGSTSVDLTKTITASWTFSDPDAGATQSKADLRWRIGAGAWTQILGASTSATQSYQFAANYFSAYAGQTVEWQVRTYDDKNAAGPWSTSAYFIPRAEPTTPTFEIAPVINSNTPTFRVDMADGATVLEYQLTADAAGAPGAVLDDETASGLPNNTASTVSMNSYAYTNGTSYHVLVRYAKYAGVWSAWLDSGALVANVNAPLQPTLVVTGLDDTGSVRIDITNPGSDPHPPTRNDVYRTDMATGEETRIASGVAINGTYTDWTPAFNKQYRYRVVALTATQAYTSSA